MPECASRYPMPCTLADFDQAQVVIALKEAEHQPLLERRFAEKADRVTYWHVGDIDVAKPTDAIAMIDRLVRDLIRQVRANF
jgi:protein-tyrosine phosphatase